MNNLSRNLIILLLLAFLITAVIIIIDPDQQLKKTRDTSREYYAAELSKAIDHYHINESKLPAISPVADSLDCQEIIAAAPLTNLAELKPEMADWFAKRIDEPKNNLFVGLKTNGEKRVCFLVESAKNLTRSRETGCQFQEKYYLCTAD